MRVGRLPVLGMALALTIACGGGSTSEAPAESGSTAAPAGGAAGGGGGQKVDSATAGTINGKAMLEGEAPKPEAIKMNADPICMKEAKGNTMTESIVTGEGGSLANVFVYVKDGLGSYVFDAPTDAVMLDQQGCRYHPHVLGVRVGQPMEIVNSDPTLHNIHALPKANQEFNTGQPIKGMKTKHVFTAKEVMVPFKCDVHGWMNAYAGVMEHPYFAVTAENGTFSLANLPPGTYTVEAWHERLGAQTQSVTIGAKESKDVNFTFKPTS